MSIYTRRGDSGKTKVYGNCDQISKGDRRINALGSVDELNAQLGSALVYCQNRGVGDKIRRIQQDLFEIGAEIAAKSDLAPPFRLRKSAVTRLEHWIDGYWKKLPPLSNFVFPGGTASAAQLNIARTVCRRAEREIVELSQEEKINSVIFAYLNRLSDFLLAAARWINKLEGVGDIIWSSASKRK